MIMKTGIEENKMIEAQKEIPIDPPVVNQGFFNAINGKVD